MPSVHIAKAFGGPLDVADEFGADFDLTSLNGKLVRITHAARDEVVLELVEPMPAALPNAFDSGEGVAS